MKKITAGLVPVHDYILTSKHKEFVEQMDAVLAAAGSNKASNKAGKGKSPFEFEGADAIFSQLRKTAKSAKQAKARLNFYMRIKKIDDKHEKHALMHAVEMSIDKWAKEGSDSTVPTTVSEGIKETIEKKPSKTVKVKVVKK